MTHPTITATTRWTRTKFREGGDWIEVECFCFTAEDGARSYADGLWPEQAAEFARQEAERAAAAAAYEAEADAVFAWLKGTGPDPRAAALGDVNIPALGMNETDTHGIGALVAACGF